jgi:hypothetical protein
MFVYYREQYFVSGKIAYSNCMTCVLEDYYKQQAKQLQKEKKKMWTSRTHNFTTNNTADINVKQKRKITFKIRV